MELGNYRPVGFVVDSNTINLEINLGRLLIIPAIPDQFLTKCYLNFCLVDSNKIIGFLVFVIISLAEVHFHPGGVKVTYAAQIESLNTEIAVDPILLYRIAITERATLSICLFDQFKCIGPKLLSDLMACTGDLLVFLSAIVIPEIENQIGRIKMIEGKQTLEDG